MVILLALFSICVNYSQYNYTTMYVKRLRAFSIDRVIYTYFYYYYGLVLLALYVDAYSGIFRGTIGPMAPLLWHKNFCVNDLLHHYMVAWQTNR